MNSPPISRGVAVRLVAFIDIVQAIAGDPEVLEWLNRHAGIGVNAGVPLTHWQARQNGGGGARYPGESPAESSTARVNVDRNMNPCARCRRANARCKITSANPRLCERCKKRNLPACEVQLDGLEGAREHPDEASVLRSEYNAEVHTVPGPVQLNVVVEAPTPASPEVRIFDNPQPTMPPFQSFVTMTGESAGSPPLPEAPVGHQETSELPPFLSGPSDFTIAEFATGALNMFLPFASQWQAQPESNNATDEFYNTTLNTSASNQRRPYSDQPIRPPVLAAPQSLWTPPQFAEADPGAYTDFNPLFDFPSDFNNEPDYN
ncbi:hypothetical protein SCHPADRAFT_998584 [Schizopora paradoxa]|uniref:Zn(2)-C6 fungal-type domain-containing protein n=1 Tax=Schizopora paradoxa TaxID=27342 RepID=A0A0H2RJZ7_9AGAM|nr:hypothetical protein SCHPADRAFT_998584 [Schizopora paradoxa]